MIGVLTITETLLYISFAVLMGGLLLHIVPSRYQPAHELPTLLLPGCCLLISIVSFTPLLPIVSYLSAQSGQEFSLISFLLFNETAQKWLILCIFSILLAVFIYVVNPKVSKESAVIAFIWSILLSAQSAWTSHASSIDALGGFLAHWVHFAAISLWFGILFIISWFSINDERWSAFLRWYTPLAMGCMIAIVAAGIVLMEYIAPEYWNSWLLPYGQALLFKHLLYVLLIGLAVINGFLLKKGMHPKWLRAETIVVLFIFLVTGFMTHSASPRDVSHVLETNGVSSLFELLSSWSWNADWTVGLAISSFSIIMILFSILFAAFMVISYRNKLSPFLFISVGCLTAVTAFVAIIVSIVPQT